MHITVQGWGSSFDHLAEQFRSMMHEVESGVCFPVSAPLSWRPRLNLYETAPALRKLIHC